MNRRKFIRAASGVFVASAPALIIPGRIEAAGNITGLMGAGGKIPAAAAAGFTGFGDVVTTGTVAFFSTRAFSAAKIGTNAIRIRNTGSAGIGGTGTTTQDFASQTNGFVSTSAATTFLGSNLGATSIWYDQIAANNGTNATLTQQPYIDFTLFSSYLGPNPTVGGANCMLTLGSTITQAQPYSWHVVMSYSAAGGGFGGTLTDGTRNFYTDNTDSLNIIAGTNQKDGSALGKHVWLGIANGASSAIYKDGVQVLGPVNAGAASITGTITLLNSGLTSPIKATVVELALIAGDISSQAAAIASNARNATVGFNF